MATLMMRPGVAELRIDYPVNVATQARLYGAFGVKRLRNMQHELDQHNLPIKEMLIRMLPEE